MSTHKVVEPTPRRFTRRQGDWIQEGGNNTLIIMGTDRAAPGPASVDDGLGTVEADGQGRGTGIVHIVVGRKDENGNPDFLSDDGFIYVAQKTDADANLMSDGIGQETKSQPAIILKSTDLRISFGGPEQAGNLKIFLDDDEKRRYVYSDSEMTQISVAEDTTVTLKEDTIEAKVAGNTIVINRDGSVTVTTDSKVDIKTKTVTVDCETMEVTGDVTMDKTLHVMGAVNMDQTLDVKVKTTSPIVAVGQITTGPGAGPSTMQGPLAVTGDVTGAGKSLSTHTHPVPLVKAGTDAATSGPPA